MGKSHASSDTEQATSLKQPLPSDSGEEVVLVGRLQLALWDAFLQGRLLEEPSFVGCRLGGSLRSLRCCIVAFSIHF